MGTTIMKEKVKEFFFFEIEDCFFFFDQKYIRSLSFKILLLVLERNFLWNGYLLHNSY